MNRAGWWNVFWTAVTIYSFILIFLKIEKYSRGYGWTYTRISFSPNPLYGLVSPKEATKGERAYFLIEIIIQLIISIAFLMALLSGSFSSLIK